jgi:hypothetical protein
MSGSDTHVDGNTLAGPFAGVFAFDITTAIASCAGCGRTQPVAAVGVYGAPMGLVARCPGCDNVLFRYLETPTGRTLDMRGVATLRLPASGAV